MTAIDVPLHDERGALRDTSSTTVVSQCTLCEAHCGLHVTVTDGTVSRIAGNPDDVFSKGYICPKATAMGGLHHDPDRLRTPMRRVGDTFEPVSWDDALAEIGARLRRIRKQHGFRSLGMYLGNPAAHSSGALYGVLLRTALLTPNFFTASSIDQMPHEYAAWKVFGSNVLVPITDIDRTHRLVILGANPAVSNGSLSIMPGAKRRIKAIRDRGGKVVVIDPRRTETARMADQHVAVRPGGDAYLLLGMLHVLIDEKLCDAHAVENAAGFSELSALVADATPEAVAERAGVSAEDIRALAREHAAAESAAIYARIGICQQETGTLVSWLVMVINAVTGNVDRAGGTMFSTPVVDVPRLARYIPVGHGLWTDRSGRHKAFRAELPAVVMADEILNPGKGQIRAMITYAGNPVSSIPQKGRLDDALSQLELYVAVDMYVTETTRHADFILPPVSPLEREDVGLLIPIFSVHNNIRYQHRAFEPPAGAKEDWEILTRLAMELLPSPVRQLTKPLRDRLIRSIDPLRLASLAIATGPYGRIRRRRNAVTMSDLKNSAGGIDLGPLRPRLRKVIATGDRKIHLAPKEFVDAASALLDKAARGPGQRYDLQLIGRRQLRSNNSWLHNVPTMTGGNNTCTVLMHPDDAAARGLAQGDTVTVASAVGAIELPLDVSDDIRPGTVAVPHGWGHQRSGWRHARTLPGANVNLLHDPDRVDSFTGTAAVNNTWVAVAAR